MGTIVQLLHTSPTSCFSACRFTVESIVALGMELILNDKKRLFFFKGKQSNDSKNLKKTHLFKILVVVGK